MSDDRHHIEENPLGTCRKWLLDWKRALEASQEPVWLPHNLERFDERGSHYHTIPELNIAVQGRLTLRLACEEQVHLEGGSYCIIPAGVFHRAYLEKDATFLALEHHTDVLSFFLSVGSGGEELSRIAMLQLRPPEGPAFHTYLNDAATLQRQAPEQVAMIQALLLAYALRLIDCTERGLWQHEPRLHRLVRETEQWLSSHLSHPELSVQWIADRLGVHPDYLSNLYHREQGVTLNRSLRLRRLALARELLRDPSRIIADVAWSCGFSSTAYFTKVFRESEKMTPGQYREKHAAGAA